MSHLGRQPGDVGSGEPAALTADAIIEQVDRICGSEPFIRSRRLVQFLRYVSEHALAGRTDQLKEYTIGVEVFERDAAYDPRIDTIVRSEARRLRAKLRDYYEREGKSDLIAIDVPKGSYVPQFLPRERPDEQPPVQPEASEAPVRSPPRLIYAVSGILIAAAAGVWLAIEQVQPPRQPVLTRITSDSGLNVWPALSRDGKLLSYSSDRAGDGNLDLYVQQVGSTADPLRLTRHEADEHQAHFSPDGRSIVYRSERDGGGVYVVPALGGAERLVAPGGHRPRFSPDGKQIAFHTAWPGKVYVVEADGGRPRRIQSDFASAQQSVWSPDGRLLLFEGQSTADEDSFDWWAAPPDGGPAIRSGLVKALRENEIYVGWDWASPSVWTADPDMVVTSARQGESTNLWRFPVSTKTGLLSGPLRRIGSGVGHEAQPSMADDGAMAFAGLSSKVDVWALPVDAEAAQVEGPMERLTDNVADDIHPHASRDGKKVVFVSRRSGKRDVRLVDLENRSEAALTNDAASEERVKISGDGRIVLFTREEADGRMAIYRVPASGGIHEEVCADCGSIAAVSSDAAQVIYNVGRAFESRWFLLDAVNGTSSPLFPEGPPIIYSPQFSPNDDRLVFEVWDGADSGRVAVAPLRGSAAAPRREWRYVSTEQNRLASPQWSPEGNLIYYLSGQDGFTCVWARRLDAGAPERTGQSFAVHHFHRARFAPFHKAYVGFSVARDKLVLSIEEKSGEIWLARQRSD